MNKKRNMSLAFLTQNELSLVAGGNCDCICYMRQSDTYPGVGAVSKGSQTNAAACKSICSGWPFYTCNPEVTQKTAV
jgi:hypothetical protein